MRRNQPYDDPGSQAVPPRPPSSLLPQQRGEFEQLSEAEMGAPHPHNYDGIFGYQAGPLRRDRPQLLLVVVEVDPVLAPVVAPGNQTKLAAREWVERMSYLKTSCRISPIDRSRRRTRMERQSAGWAAFVGSCWIM